MATPVDAKLLRQTKFPPEFSRKVDMTKVNIEVMKKWIAGRISEILGNEDDVVIELCFNLLEGARYPNIKALQIQLTGFLDKDTSNFCKELWSLCLSGQENPQGVPKELLEAKKLELIQEKLRNPLADRGSKTSRETGKWMISDGENVEIAEIADEQEEALATVAVTLVAGDHAHHATEAGIDTVNPHLAANSILTSHLAPTEVADQLGPLLDLDPPPAPHLAPHHVAAIKNDVIDPQIVSVAAITVDPLPPMHETAEKRDAIRTTVIDTDPLPAVNHPAHELPEETDGKGAQSPAA
ncbi:uncharacterized protein N7483_012017 [Penicillium malachiteum]|uniref:uncharacterized protein n=1 Tax=Penicillium malachiteum TaxID=1324776 RepID=UPI002547DC46|nr:uncharacterized protein N7483_012017 [Penicillium malachiteum]KAJ5714836.1 hypothetical protein N7483_012017 [Penicillium malachiteum]